MNMARECLYRFSALALVDPRRGTWAYLDALRSDLVLREAARLIANRPRGRTFELAPGELPPAKRLDPAAVLERLPRSPHALHAAYERTFGLVVSSACPPYETEYIDSKFTYQRSNALADINGFYQAFGFCVSQEHRERPDHVVLELEFMAALSCLERGANVMGGPAGRERREVCHLAQVRFFREHLAWWLPAFARLLSRENPETFYGAVGEFLAALVPAERRFLQVAAPPRLSPPSRVEPPEMCEGCQLAV
jgi:TorA maturation chaperone TorD